MYPSIYLLLVTRRAKKDGTYPVKLRVVYNREYHDYPIGINLSQDQYDNATVSKPKKQYKELSIELEAVKARANEIIKNITPFTFQKFEGEFRSTKKSAFDIFPVYDEYIALIKAEDRIKTASSYTTAKNSFKSFKNKIGFYDITAEFLKRYHTWMVEQGNSITTIGIYVRSLRAVYNYAINPLGIIKRDENYPFDKRNYMIPAGRNIKKALSFEEVKKIYNHSVEQGSPADKAKDFWMFSYLCTGVNFKDIALLKNKDIDGNMIRFVRAKTKNTTQGNQTTISYYISEQVQNIINKWKGDDTRADAYLFPVLAKGDDPETEVKKIAQFIKNTNDYIKKIAAAEGITKTVTTYFARHSAATILKKSGANVEQIREALGHHSTSTTMKYLDSFDDDTKKELSTSLTSFL